MSVLKPKDLPQQQVYHCSGMEEEYHKEHQVIWNLQGNGITVGTCLSCKKVLAVEVNSGTTKFQFNTFLK